MISSPILRPRRSLQHRTTNKKLHSSLIPYIDLGLGTVNVSRNRQKPQAYSLSGFCVLSYRFQDHFQWAFSSNCASCSTDNCESFWLAGCNASHTFLGNLQSVNNTCRTHIVHVSLRFPSTFTDSERTKIQCTTDVLGCSATGTILIEATILISCEHTVAIEGRKTFPTIAASPISLSSSQMKQAMDWSMPKCSKRYCPAFSYYKQWQQRKYNSSCLWRNKIQVWYTGSNKLESLWGTIKCPTCALRKENNTNIIWLGVWRHSIVYSHLSTSRGI